MTIGTIPVILLVLAFVDRERVATSWQDRFSNQPNEKLASIKMGDMPAVRKILTVRALPTTTAATTTQERFYGDLAQEL